MTGRRRSRRDQASGAPRRVLLVLATSAGGVGRHVADLAHGLAQPGSGFAVLVAGPARPRAGPGAGGAGFGFAVVGIADRPRPLRDARAVLRLRSLMAGQEVVHAHGLRAGALAALAARLLTGRRRPALVVTLHNALVSGGRIAVVHRILERIVARGADVVLVVSADLGEAMAAQGAQDVRLAVVPAPPLPPPDRAPAEVRAGLAVPAGAFLLVTVARLAPQKGLDVLIDAVAALADGRDPGTAGVLAVIAGDGPLHDQLARQAAAQHAPVRLLGHRNDVAALIGAADVVVMPSRWEGQPLAAQEALRAGAALVATDAGGTAALVQDGAVLVPPGDAPALAAALRELLIGPDQLATARARAQVRGVQLPGAQDALQAVERLYRGFTHPE